VAEGSVSASNFAFVAELLRRQCGLVLEPGKEYLVTTRLASLVSKYQLSSVDQLIEQIQRNGSSLSISEIVELMVTTETSFFRDVQPFEILRTHVLPELIDRRRHKRTLNIWCSAGASGQEPYSIAIILKEYFAELVDWRITISATDISQAMLQRSRLGSYSQLEVDRGLPAHLMKKWFRQDGAQWNIVDTLRSSVTFTHLNLTQPWPAMPLWDLVFLRNVMIYFDNETKRAILQRVARVLCADGYLVLGSAESTLNLSDAFVRANTLGSGYYQLR
jgi:chemotaxis protein methyltransferase CheR